MPPAPRQCTPPRLTHSLRRTRMRPHSATRICTEHVSCELLSATHTHNTLHCTCTFLHSAHNKRVMIFLDTASTTHAPRASSRFSHALRASTALYRTRIRNRERKWLRLCSLLRWHCTLTLCTVFLLAQDRRQQMDRAIFLLRPFRRESIWSSARSQASSSGDDRRMGEWPFCALYRHVYACDFVCQCSNVSLCSCACASACVCSRPPIV